MSIASSNVNIRTWAHNFHHIAHVSCKVKKQNTKVECEGCQQRPIVYSSLWRHSWNFNTSTQGRTKFLALLQVIVTSPTRKDVELEDLLKCRISLGHDIPSLHTSMLDKSYVCILSNVLIYTY